jgi:hypothetical protein
MIGHAVSLVSECNAESSPIRAAIVNFRLQSRRESLPIVTGSVRDARNPLPTR